MAALRSRCGHYIFVLWFLLPFFFIFSFFISLFCLVPCGRLSWLFDSFWAHVNILRIASYRIVGLSYLSFLFLAYSQPSQIVCLPYFHTWCGLSANLGCRSETCCTRLAENIGRKNTPKIRHLGTIAQIWWAIPWQLGHVSTMGNKLVKRQYLPHMSLQYGELRPTSG